MPVIHNVKDLYQQIKEIEDRIGHGVAVEITKRGKDLIIHGFWFSAQLHTMNSIRDVEEMSDEESQEALDLLVGDMQDAYRKWGR